MQSATPYKIRVKSSGAHATIITATTTNAGSAAAASAAGSGEAGGGTALDGMESLDYPTVHLRFGRDLRLDEARALLQSHAPVVLHTRNSTLGTDSLQQQAKLGLLLRRSFALAVGE